MVPAFSAPLSFSHIKDEVDVPIIDITHIAQDYRGFIWVGGINGLARYDGHIFKTYRNSVSDSKSLSGNYIYGILEDKKNNLWVATTEGLNLYNRNEDNFTHFNFDRNAKNNQPSKSLTSIMYDKQGKIWIGSSSGINIFDPEKKKFIDMAYVNNQVGGMIIFSIYEDMSGDVWLGTRFNGLYHVDVNEKTIKSFTHNENIDNSLSNNSVNSIVENRRGELWIATAYGLNRLDSARKNFTHFYANPFDVNSISQNMVWALFIDKNDDLWVSTDGAGLDIYNRETNHFSHNRHYKYQPNSLSSNKVRDIFEDNHGGIWIASMPSGLDYTNPARRAFEILQFIPFADNSLVSDLILTIHEDTFHNIWIGTEGGLSKYDPRSGRFVNYVHAESGQSISAHAVLALESDDDGNIWIGTWSGGLNKLNPRSGEITVYIPETDESVTFPNAVSSRFIWGLDIDANGYLWIGSETGYVDRLNLETGVFDHFNGNPGKPDGISNRFIRNIFVDSRADVWVSTNAGLNRLNQETGNYVNYYRNERKYNSLPQNQARQTFEDSENNLWVATGGGLSIFRRHSNDFKNFSKKDGLPADTIAGITQDHDGRLWLATTSGISRFDFKKNEFKNFTTIDGIAGDVSNRPAIHYSSYYNRVFVGSDNGVTVIDPDAVTDNTFIPPVVFTELKVNNEIIDSLNENILSKNISMSSVVNLDHSHKMLSISFASLDYSRPLKNKYKYKMEGFDQAWVESGVRNYASYTNLPAGSYEFLVLGSNGDGVWGEFPARLKVVVAPALWATYWAYFLYATIAALFLYFSYMIQKRSLKFEQDKVAHFKYIDKIKDKILANTSHELRTPLNGIIGLAESLAEEADNRNDTASAEKLKTIAFSGKRLSNLINDILDFSKLKEHDLITAKKLINVKHIVHNIFELTLPLLGNKNVTLNNLINADVFVYTDEARLQQILLNLVGNAVKFTDQGSISLSSKSEGGMIHISIKDTGIGIAKENLNTIFVSFLQLESHQTRRHSGSGLGLSITKKLVGLLGGSIVVESTLGAGSEFIFTLPTSGEMESNENRYLVASNAELQTKHDIETNEFIPDSKINKYEKIYDLIFYGTLRSRDYHKGYFSVDNNAIYTILIVDDDPVNRMVISAILKKWNFSVLEACDGYEAIDLVYGDNAIDMLVLDVMMPGMSGMKVCEKIREKYRREELPILFLTANYNEHEFTNGFLSGGDGFILKPISKDILKDQISLNLSMLDEYRRSNHLTCMFSEEQFACLADIEYDTLTQAYSNMVDVLQNMFDNLFVINFWVWDAKKEIYYSVDNVMKVGSVQNYFSPTSKFVGFIDGFNNNVATLISRRHYNKISELNLSETGEVFINPLEDQGVNLGFLVYTTNTSHQIIHERMMRGSVQLGLILVETLKKIKIMNLKFGW